ncbi:MAG: hypothetical protein HY816_18250 [Candidatus Wallbacteria bacterium]|nr:hypothetical protein [Candidatus Wallbacteria bacterium]
MIRLASLSLPVVLLVPALAWAQAPDTSDLRAVDSAPAVAVQATSAFGPGAPVALYELLDEAGSPKGQSDLARFYQSYVDDYRAARGKLEGKPRLAQSKETFESFLGETSWTASACRDTVETSLRWLQGRRAITSSPQEQKAYDAMTLELIRDVAERASAAGRPGLAKTLASGYAPQQGWSIRELAKQGVELWDYDLAAFRLMEWIDRRDTILSSPELAKLLNAPPDPAAARIPQKELERDLTTLGDAAWGNDARSTAALEARGRLSKALSELKSAGAERDTALASLASMLGVRSINTSPDLQRLARRYLRAHRGDPQASARLHAALTRYSAALASEDAALRRYRQTAAQIRFELGLGSKAMSASSTSATQPATGDAFDNIDPGSIPSRLRKELYKADLSASLKLLDMDVATGVGLSAKYKWQIDGNLEDQYATRIDTWEFGTNLRIGDMIRDIIDLPLGINISANEKIVLARQFKSKMKAATAIPKTPLALPLTAERARKMEMGDFWSLPADLSFATGIGTGYALGPVSTGAGANYVVSGRFRINIFKTDPDHVRIRITGNRGWGPGVSADVNAGGLEIVGISFLNRLIKRTLDLHVFSVGWNWSKGTGFSGDYIFDLRDAAASRAYEKVLKGSLKSGPALAANAIIRAHKLDDIIMNDLRPAEEIFHEDRSLEPGRRRVDRVFKGMNRYTAASRNFRIGTKLMRFDTHSSWVENHLRVFDAEEETHDYYFPVLSFRSNWNFLFGLFKEDNEQSMYALLPEGSAPPSPEETDAIMVAEAPEPEAVRDLVFSQTIQDKSARKGEMNAYRKALERAMGPKLSAELDFDNFPAGAADKFNAQLTFSVHGPTLERLLDPARTSDDKVWEAVARLIPDFDLPSSAPARADGPATKPWGYYVWLPSRQKAYDVCEQEWGPHGWSGLEGLMDDFLKMRLSGALPEKTVALMKLGKERLFRLIGLRLLIEMAQDIELEDAFYVAVAVRAKDRPDYAATLGEDRFKDLYAIINEALYNLSEREQR